MRRTVIDADHQRLQPVPHEAEQVTGADLAIGGLQHPSQTRVVVRLGSRSLEQVPQDSSNGSCMRTSYLYEE